MTASCQIIHVLPALFAWAGGETPDTFISIVFSGGPIGIAIMLILIATSMASMYLVIEQALNLRRKIVLPEKLGDRVRTNLLAGRVAEAQQACRDTPSVLSAVLARGLEELDGGYEAVEEAVEDALAEQSARLFRRVEYLSVLANLAPMLGLLGTVVGMVLCFREVASTQGNAGAAQLADGIYQALVTTVAGLMIAIPSLAAFALFRNRVDQIIAEAASIALHVYTPLKRRSGERAAPTSTASPATSSVTASSVTASNVTAMNTAATSSPTASSVPVGTVATRPAARAATPPAPPPQSMAVASPPPAPIPARQDAPPFPPAPPAPPPARGSR